MNDDLKAGTERFKAAVEKIRSGESDSEEVELSSGRVRITADESAPTGIRIEPLDPEGDGSVKSRLGPDAAAHLERMREATERVHSGESDSEEVTLPSGGTMIISQDQSSPGTLIMQSAEEGLSVRSTPIEATAERPPHYPEDLPFLPQSVGMLSEESGGPSRTLLWFKPADPDGWFGRIQEELTAEGWEETEDRKASAPGGATRWLAFSRGALMRVLTTRQSDKHSYLSLREGPKRKLDTEKGDEG